jgi:hypothetical protein
MIVMAKLTPLKISGYTVVRTCLTFRNSEICPQSVFADFRTNVSIVSIPLCYEYDIHKYFTIFSQTQLSSLLLTSIIGATCSAFLVHYSSSRRPEDGGLKTPKHVAPVIDVNNQELIYARQNIL